MYKAWCIYILTYISLFLWSTAAAQQTESPTIKGKLENGLTYYVRHNPYPAGEAVYRLFLKTGSLAEQEAQRGLAHFLEHMAFNGTHHFPGDSLVRFLEQQGAKFGKDLNAHTSYNETVYKLQLPSKDSSLVNKTLTILADWIGGLQLDSTAIEKERGIIYSEWLSRKTGGQGAEEAFLNALFNGSHYADRKVIGDTAVILHAPAGQIRTYYQDWYSPSLTAVAIVGDIDEDQVVKLIKDKFGALPGNNKQPREWPIPNYTKSSFHQVIDDGESKAELHVIRLLDLPQPVRNREEHLHYLESDLLRLLIRKRFRDLAFQNPAYTKGSLQSSGFLNTKQIVLASVGINPDKPDSSIIEFATNLAQLVQYGFDSNEIASIKKSYEAALQRKASSNRPTPSAILMDDIYNDYYKGQPAISAQQEYDWYVDNTTQIDSTSLLRHLQGWYYPDNAYYLLTGYPQIASILPSETQVMSWFQQAHDKVQPRYHKPMDIVTALLENAPSPAIIVAQGQRHSIDAEEIGLSNGVRVIFRKPVVERDRISVTGFRKGGLYSLDSTDYISGLYTSQIVALSGAGDLDRESLNHYLSGSSASVRFLIDKTRSGIAGSADPRDIETLLQLIYLKWTAPRVDSTTFGQIKEKAVDTYRHTNQTPASIFGRDLGYIVNGRDYTNQEITDQVLAKDLRQDRLLPIFDRAFGPASGYTFIVVADPKDEELKEMILSYLGALPGGTSDTAYRYVRPPVAAGTTFIKYDGDTPKATVWLTYQSNSIPMDYQDYQLRTDIATAVLRTQFLKELREEMGKVYSVGVTGSSTLLPGPLARTSIQFSCKPDDAEFLVQAIHNRIQRLIDHPESMAATLEDVKNNLRKEMQLNKQKDSFWSSYIRNAIFNGDESLLFVTDYEDKLREISPSLIADFINLQLGTIQPIKAILYPAGFDKSTPHKKDNKKNNKTK